LKLVELSFTLRPLWCKGCICALSVHITTNWICSRIEHFEQWNTNQNVV